MNWTMKQTVRAKDNPRKVTAAFRQLKQQYKGKQHWYTDGSVRSNSEYPLSPNVGCGIYCKDKQTMIKLPRQCSIMSAEAYAIREALQQAQAKVIIFTDSASAMAAIEGGTSKHPWVQQIENLMLVKHITLCWIPSHTGILGNESADRLANEALHLETLDIAVPACDARRWSQLAIRLTWETEWRNSGTFLSRLKPSTLPRRDQPSKLIQRALSRIRIGHKKLTHTIRFTKQQRYGTCPACNTDLTIEHLLTNCRTYENARRKVELASYIETSLHQQPEEEEKLIQFLKMTKLINVL